MASRLAKDSLIYGLGTILGRSFGFVMIPVYTRFLTVQEYGALAILNIILQGVSFLYLLGIGTASMRFYFDRDADDRHQQDVYANATALLLILPPVIILALAPASRWLSEQYLPSIPFEFVFIILVTGTFTPLAKLMSGLLRVRKKPVAFISFQLAFFLVQTIAIVVAVVILRRGLEGQLYSQLFSNAVFMLIALVVLLRFSRPKLSKPIAIRMLKFGLPLVPFFLLTWMNKGAGRFILENYAGLGELGVFALAAQFSGLILLAGTALDNAFMPHFLDEARQESSKAQLGSLVTKYIVLFGLIALSLIAFGPAIIMVMAVPEYHPAADFIAPLALASWIQVCCQPAIWSLTHSMRPATMTAMRLLSVIVLIVGAVWLVGERATGVLGLAAAMCLANLVMLFASYGLSQHFFPMPLEWRRLLLSITLLLAGGVLLAWLPAQTLEPWVLGSRAAATACVSVAALRLIGIRNPFAYLLDSVRGR